MEIYDFDILIYTVSQAAINKTDYPKVFSKLPSMLLTFKLYISIQKKAISMNKLNKAGNFLFIAGILSFCRL